jgi:hypothetical protein
MVFPLSWAHNDVLQKLLRKVRKGACREIRHRVEFPLNRKTGRETARRLG